MRTRLFAYYYDINFAFVKLRNGVFTANDCLNYLFGSIHPPSILSKIILYYLQAQLMCHSKHALHCWEIMLDLYPFCKELHDCCEEQFFEEFDCCLKKLKNAGLLTTVQRTIELTGLGILPD